MELETRVCADTTCRAKFRCLPNSPQTGCCRNHDERGKVFVQKFTLRRKKKKTSYDPELGVELVDVTEEILEPFPED